MSDLTHHLDWLDRHALPTPVGKATSCLTAALRDIDAWCAKNESTFDHWRGSDYAEGRRFAAEEIRSVLDRITGSTDAPPGTIHNQEPP